MKGKIAEKLFGGVLFVLFFVFAFLAIKIMFKGNEDGFYLLLVGILFGLMGGEILGEP